MSREIRKVPKNWMHPRYNHPQYYPQDHSERAGRYHPLRDADYDVASKEWTENFNLWQKREHPDFHEEYYFWEWEGNPPEEVYYRSKKLGTDFQEPADCFQIYETVSEGTPISPKFNSLEDLAVWLIGQGYSEKAASEFCKLGYSFSMVISGGRLYKDMESLAIE